jgi:hypothetical protein
MVDGTLTIARNPLSGLPCLVPFGIANCLSYQTTHTADIKKHLMIMRLQKGFKKRVTMQTSSRTGPCVSAEAFAASKNMKTLQILTIKEGTLSI